MYSNNGLKTNLLSIRLSQLLNRIHPIPVDRNINNRSVGVKDNRPDLFKPFNVKQQSI